MARKLGGSGMGARRRTSASASSVPVPFTTASTSSPSATSMTWRSTSTMPTCTEPSCSKRAMRMCVLLSVEDAILAKAALLRGADAEHLAERPLRVLSEQRAGSVVAARDAVEAEAVAFVLARPELRVLEGDQVAAAGELRVVVQITEVLHRYRLDPRSLQLLRDRERLAFSGPGFEVAVGADDRPERREVLLVPAGDADPSV